MKHYYKLTFEPARLNIEPQFIITDNDYEIYMVADECVDILCEDFNEKEQIELKDIEELSEDDFFEKIFIEANGIYTDYTDFEDDTPPSSDDDPYLKEMEDLIK